MKTEAQARKAALACKRQLDKVWSGWKVEVWDNLGWHWKVVRNNLSVRDNEYSTRGTFRCWIHVEPDCVGIPSEWGHLFTDHPDPVSAVRDSVKNLIEWLMRKVTEQLEFIVFLESSVPLVQQEKKSWKAKTEKKPKPKKRSRRT